MSKGIKRYIAELIQEADRYEVVADSLQALPNKPANWLDLWIGCRMRAWDNRMRAGVMARRNRIDFHRLIRSHVRGEGGCNAS